MTIEPFDFGADRVDNVDTIVAADINNLRAWLAYTAALGRNANTETLAANKTLVDSDEPIQFLDPSATEYTVELPAEGNANHVFYFVNTSASYDLEILDDAATTIVTIEPEKAAIVMSDGADWKMIASTNAPTIPAATQITETSGPTTLDIGAIADGAFLKRSGTGVVGEALSDIFTDIDSLNFDEATELTITSGSVTATQSVHKLQPQSGTADDLDTISGLTAGDIVILYASDAGTDTITLKHGTGNLSCFGGADIELSEGMVVGYYDGTTVFISGGGGSSNSFVSARVERTSSQSIPNKTNTAIQYDTENWDTDGMADLVSHNTRITIQEDGLYEVFAVVVFDFNTTGVRYANVALNGTGNWIGGAGTMAYEGYPTLNVNIPKVELSADDYLEIYVYQSKGSALDVIVTSYPVIFGVTKVADVPA